jgi:hypothetical protein
MAAVAESESAVTIQPIQVEAEQRHPHAEDGRGEEIRQEELGVQ